MGIYALIKMNLNTVYLKPVFFMCSCIPFAIIKLFPVKALTLIIKSFIINKVIKYSP
jgi:hypothetical protein